MVFRSSSNTVIDGLKISDVNGEYAAIVAAGFKNTSWKNCSIRGGSLSGAIVILNDCQFTTTPGIGWNGTSDYLTGNGFKWGRGSKHLIDGCKLFESRQMGLMVTGSDIVDIRGTLTFDNAESGIQTGQYSSAYPQESIICKHVVQTNCKSWGNYYDGFDHASVTSGANGPYFDKFLQVSNCESYGNRATGMFVQGNGLQINNNNFHDNGTHGLRVEDSSSVEVVWNKGINNGLLNGGYQFFITGSDAVVSDNEMSYNDALPDAHLINISLGKQNIVTSGITLNNAILTTYASPDVVIGEGVILKGEMLMADGVSLSVAGKRTSTLFPTPKAGITESRSLNSEGGAVAAWRHPYSGAYLRLLTGSITADVTTPMTLAYNRGINATNPTGYQDIVTLGGTGLSFYPTSFLLGIWAAGTPGTLAGGYRVSVNSIRPEVGNAGSLGETGYRFASCYLTSWNMSGTTLLPVSNNTNTIGSSSLRLTKGFFTDLDLTNPPVLSSGVLGVKVAVPASATATGTVGQWAADSGYIYICVSANTWVRAPLATW